jgi:branched-chain amino acid transport system permease protein
MIGQVVLNGVVLGASLALLSIGLTLAYGVMHIVNFAHGAIYMLGAYAVLYLSQHGVSFAGAFVLSVGAMAALAVPFHIVLYRRVYGKFMDSLLMTVGLTLVIEGVVQLAMGAEHHTPASYFGRVFDIFGIAITGERLVVVLASLILLGGVYVFISHTRIGLGVRAVEQDTDVADLYGVNRQAVSLLVLALSFALAAAAGALLAPLIFVGPYIGDDAILLAFAVVILGGLGSVSGSLIAAFVLGLTLSFSETYLSLDAGRMLFFGLVGVVLLVRPTGLLGRAVA